MMSLPDDVAIAAAEPLCTLAETWWRAFGLPVKQRVDRVASTITNVEPFRSQALSDAELYLQMPVLTGIGATLRMLPLPRAVAFESWPVTFAPFDFQVRWSRTMSDGFNEHVAFSLARVAVSDFEARVVAVLPTVQAREELRAALTLLAQRA